MGPLHALDVRSEKKKKKTYPTIPYAIHCDKIPIIKPV
jgi:hypothetical protein